MPCNTIVKNSVAIKATNRALLKAGIADLGWTVVRESKEVLTVRAQNGVPVEIRQAQNKAIVEKGQEGLVDQIKQAYSRQVVTSTARRYGFQFRQTGKNEYELVKR